jgi:putative tricarboxylic transport membrane protein
LKKGELIVGALFVLLAAVVIGDTFRMGSGWTEYGPDAGFVPFWEAVLLMISAFVILLSGMKQKGGDTFFTSKEGFWEAVRITFTSILLTIGIVFLGVYVSTILYAVLFARWLGKHRWPACIAFSIIMTLVIFFGMEKGLKITLPKSPLYWKGLFIF